MQKEENPIPLLTTAIKGPLYHLEAIILDQVSTIEAWFRKKWQETPPPITSSVDLRHAGFKLAPVDTNLFPAGFNNLNPDFFPLCIQAAQSTLLDTDPTCAKILILPESHTRNTFYLQSLVVLRDIFVKAGFVVRIGSLDEAVVKPTILQLTNGRELLVEPLIREGNRLKLRDFDPCMLLLNNDLSSGLPNVLENLEQPIRPNAELGWDKRLKSSHFYYYDKVASEFAELIGMDSWLINPLFESVDGVDFMAQEGLEPLVSTVENMLLAIAAKYKQYGITEKPYVVIKADNGTYGMGVMTVHDAGEILALNRKQRTRMATSKGSRKVDKVLVQEGVFTFETMPNGAVAEPVVYMIGQFVVGGFYRVHKERGKDENLNAPGMHFEPLAFAKSCNMPCHELAVQDCPNRFYAYGVIARLAALAAAKEIEALGVRS